MFTSDVQSKFLSWAERFLLYHIGKINSIDFIKIDKQHSIIEKVKLILYGHIILKLTYLLLIAMSIKKTSKLSVLDYKSPRPKPVRYKMNSFPLLRTMNSRSRN